MNPEACVPVIVLGKGMSDRFNVEWVPSSLLLLSEAWDIIKNLKLCMPVYRQLLKKLHRLCYSIHILQSILHSSSLSKGNLSCAWMLKHNADQNILMGTVTGYTNAGSVLSSPGYRDEKQ